MFMSFVWYIMDFRMFLKFINFSGFFQTFKMCIHDIEIPACENLMILASLLKLKNIPTQKSGLDNC